MSAAALLAVLAALTVNAAVSSAWSRQGQLIEYLVKPDLQRVLGGG